MIKRIVKLEFGPEGEKIFMEIFRATRQLIRQQPGCLGLELLRHEAEGKITLMTYSFWASEADLEHYRRSDLFKDTWAKVKPLFAGKPQAWSLHSVDHLP